MKNKRKFLTEGYGAGFSFTGGAVKGMGGTSRGGFGGANNLGGPNMMYTYEIKPLNHTLEQKPSDVGDQVPKVQIGSKVSGVPFRSNATPSPKRISGIIKKIVKTEDNSIKYYIIQNELTQNFVKIDPLTTSLIIHEPVEYYFDTTDNIPSRRKEKMKKHMKKSKYVPESLDEMNERLNESMDQPSPEIIKVLNKFVGSESQFQRTVKNALKYSPFKIKDAHFYWRNCVNGQKYKSGQFTCGWYTGERKTSDVTPGGTYHQREGIHGLFQINLHSHVNENGILIEEADFNAAYNKAGGMATYKSEKLISNNKKENSDSITSYVSSILYSINKNTMDIKDKRYPSVY